MSHPTFTVEIGTAPGYEPAGWTDVTSRLLGPEGDFGTDIEHDYGRRDELSEDESGVLSFILDNDDGNWEFGVDPDTAVRVTATLGATTYDVAYGVVESAPAVWPAQGLARGQVQVTVADGLTLLARTEIGETTRPAELSGARIGAVLDLAGWPAGMRDLDDGRVIVDELGDYDSDGELQDVIVNALHAIRDAVEAEQGQIYIDPDGSFVFKDRHSRLDNSAVVEFGPSDVEYDDLVPSYNDRFLWPTARVELSGGTIVEVTDDAAVALGYGGLPSGQPSRVFPIRDLATTDIEAEALAAWIVVRYSVPRRRLEQLVLRAVTDTEVQAALTLRPGDLVRVQSTTPAIDETAHIEQIDRRIGSDVIETVFSLSPYFGAGPWLRFGDTTAGFDVGGLAP